MNNLFEKEWLEKNIFYDSLNENKLKHIFYFPILWNIFEKEIFNTKASIFKVESKSQTISILDENSLNKIYNYFKNRYIQSADKFKGLNFREDEKKFQEKIKECFNKDNISLQEKIEVLLYIAFRIRNNIYHGIKQVHKLYEQNENFAQINKFLILIIEGYKK
jgi:hypothetical protein